MSRPTYRPYVPFGANLLTKEAASALAHELSPRPWEARYIPRKVGESWGVIRTDALSDAPPMHTTVAERDRVTKGKLKRVRAAIPRTEAMRRVLINDDLGTLEVKDVTAKRVDVHRTIHKTPPRGKRTK
jgi:hypothetical protein